MTDAVSRNPARPRVTLPFIAFSMALLFPNLASAHLLTFSKQNVIDYTPDNPFDRLPDGRPKVPDELIERARDLSSEEVWAVLQEKGFNNQYADGFQVLRRGKTMVGRVFTAQFMPLRANVDDVAKKKNKARGVDRLTNQTMSFFRHGEIYPSDGGANRSGERPQSRLPAHRSDESPAGYSLASCSPAELASASPAERHPEREEEV